ncbi:MAG: response regulator [Candidatus Krumholzibacteriota bacterium]|nr:response regulator [Candidatus Krumholzibacteriota bacterium]
MEHKSANILLVEDNKMDIELTLNAFRDAKLINRIEVARNGREALDLLNGEGQYAGKEIFTPDIILLDLKMPGIDGHEVLKTIKNTRELKKIPVIILTSSKEEGDREMSYDNGANSYLVKPVSFEGFIKVARMVGDYWVSLNVGPTINRSPGSAGEIKLG